MNVLPTNKRDWQRELLALVCLCIAALIGSLTYPDASIFSWGKTQKFVPDLTSSLVALGLIVPVIRGDFLHNHKLDLLNIITACVAFYVAAVFIRIGLGASKNWMSGPTTFFAFALLAVINFNPKKYGELAILGLLLCGTVNIVHANKVLEIWGFFLVLFAALGSFLLIDAHKLKRALLPTPDS